MHQQEGEMYIEIQELHFIGAIYGLFGAYAPL